MVDLSKLKKNNSRGGNGPRQSQIAVEYVRTELKNPKEATPGEDVAVFRMLHPAEGFPEYTQDADLNPTTEIKMVLDKRDISGEHAPLEFFDFRRGKGQTKPVASGATIVLEGASYDSRKQQGRARWIHIGTYAAAGPSEFVHASHLISVGKESYEDVEGKRRYRQTRWLALPNEAKAFNSLADFKDKAAKMLEGEPDIGGDKPGVWIRILNTTDAANDRVTTTLRLGYIPGENGQPGRQMTPEESVENFLNSPRMTDWVDNINLAGTADAKDYLFELIPFYQWNTGDKSLPKGKPKSDSDAFQMEGDNGKTFSGFADAHIFVRRKITPAAGDEPEEMSGWFATKTIRVNRFGPLAPREEIITENLPENVKKAFTETAAKRGEKAFADMRASKDQASKPQAKDTSEEDLAFADPDHGRSVTPR